MAILKEASQVKKKKKSPNIFVFLITSSRLNFQSSCKINFPPQWLGGLPLCLGGKVCRTHWTSCVPVSWTQWQNKSGFIEMKVNQADGFEEWLGFSGTVFLSILTVGLGTCCWGYAPLHLTAVF